MAPPGRPTGEPAEAWWWRGGRGRSPRGRAGVDRFLAGRGTVDSRAAQREAAAVTDADARKLHGGVPAAHLAAHAAFV
jgi:hypothetical protein